ncbi:hypothetical protein ACWIYZ_07705 [Ursidibacter arcticus]
MSNKFTLQGNPQDFTQSIKKISDVLSLLNVMTGVDHSKADTTSISVSIEIVADLLSNAYEDLAMMTIQGAKND